jgi:hypothetical protein
VTGRVTHLDPAAYSDLSDDLKVIAAGFTAGGNSPAWVRLTVGFEGGAEMVMELRRADGDGDPAEG